MFGLVAAFTLFAADVAAAKSSALSDSQIRQQIIEDSIASYSGSCACPFNQARNGSSCGKRSAWSRQGGAAPICYKNEVTKEMVNEWREQHAQQGQG
ncbi:hypothetical protein N5923_18560 [Erwiniaceae bacterium BAC15a-03b]|uniref:Uncharacterized protein n=1 Tax=Winslowiella arboricola TaxID=2978220 RepID=A0A9J6PME8_9GAMM|nr:hypothetical protein [Winslowiella arboricola]MCU5775661.1 hypothetical protein [Winslowiella arboricola]MCU5779489.1 hypothetical protein [Winslowiella arboricola]